MRASLERRLRHVEAKQKQAQPLWLREWLGDDLGQNELARADAERGEIDTRRNADVITLPGDLRRWLAAREHGGIQ